MEKIKIGDVCDILNGYAFKSENYVDSGIRIIRISNVQKGYIEDSTPAFYSFDTMGLSKFMLEEGDLLMSLTGNVGRVAILEKELLPAALNQRVACLRLKSNKITKSYLFHFLNSNFFEQQCIMASNGVAQKNMSTEWLKDYEIPLYTPNQQEEIVTVLNAAQSILSSRRQQLQKLDDLVKARFVELFGDINANDREWNVQPLGELCTIVRGGSPRPIEKYLGGDIPWIKIGDATDGESIYLYSTKEHITQAGVSKSRMVKSGSLIFANCGVSLGFARIITFDGCIHDGWLAMENINERLDKVFLLQSLNQMTEHFRRIAPAGTQPNLNTAIMKDYKQIIPPLELQKEFIAFVAQTDKSKVAVQKALDEAQMLFDSLMQKYFE